MPIETVNITTTALPSTYYLVAFDANGNERLEPTGFISQKLVDILATEPITDVFLISHGWMGDIPAAKEQYTKWITAMGQNSADIQTIKKLRQSQNQEFRPLLIGLHWPSKPWGNEDLNAKPTSYDTSGSELNNLIDEYAQDVADTEAARDALRTIFAASIEYANPPETLPQQVNQAYEVLIKEASLNGYEEDGASLNLNPANIYQSLIAEEPETQEISFGIGDFFQAKTNPFLDVLGYLSYWKMKERAREIGSTSGFKLLTQLQKAAAKTVRFHLVGHSFGCIVVSSIVAGKDKSQLVRPVDSLVLIQGALSLWSYCPDIPRRKNLAGCFSSILKARKVTGPIVTTRSIHDSSVTKLYPAASVLGRFQNQDINFAETQSEFPEYGSIGTFGIQGINESTSLKMYSCNKEYNFQAGKVYNLESSEFIRNINSKTGKDEDAHNSIDKKEVAHAVWAAAFGS
ncbi:hypothetical protein ACX27_01215 [Nostoc piscinale CENA21]|uniref:Uncharacterized protein n=1 Tax=Nostoc piscinale CENA21 TaxID=224013 RepID=A0A0M3V4D9_9NOSO|nr:hypothetical protein [Nostoc piscinale]ALF51777.1 hypothetical protein ACX27_01215 [Nostoc piscinale CENA21]